MSLDEDVKYVLSFERAPSTCSVDGTPVGRRSSVASPLSVGLDSLDSGASVHEHEKGNEKVVDGSNLEFAELSEHDWWYHAVLRAKTKGNRGQRGRYSFACADAPGSKGHCAVAKNGKSDKVRHT
jgi:hypothetical protein